MEALAELEGLTEIPLADIEAARDRLKATGKLIRTPLVPLNYDVPGKKIYLKLENLQVTSSVKPRGSMNALHMIPVDELRHGVWTASSGNFAQGLSWAASSMGISCNAVVPDTTPQSKLDAIRQYGGQIQKVPFDTCFRILMDTGYEGMQGTFIHPGCNRNVMAGNGTAGLEIVEDLPEVDTIICPFGSGGLASGIASAVRAIKPEAEVFLCEPETATPAKTSFEAGKPCMAVNYTSSFIDGMGGKGMVPQMWGLVSHLVADSVVVSLQEVVDAVRLLVERNHLVAEGAAAATVAAALKDEIPPGNIVCFISGGNIDTSRLIKCLQGEIPD